MDAGKKRSAAQANLGLANHRPVKRRHQYRKPSIPYQRTPFGLDLAALGVANLAQSAMAFVSKGEPILTRGNWLVEGLNLVSSNGS